MPNDSERLDNGLAAGEFDSLLIFASNPFLGELRTLLSEAVERRVRLWLNNDLTALGIAQIEARLPSNSLSTSSLICVNAHAQDPPTITAPHPSSKEMS